MCRTNKIVGQETENVSDKIKETFVEPESELPYLIMNMAIDQVLINVIKDKNNEL